MCRWFAYVSPSEPAILEDLLITPENSLSHQVHDHYLPRLVPHGMLRLVLSIRTCVPFSLMRHVRSAYPGPGPRQACSGTKQPLQPRWFGAGLVEHSTFFSTIQLLAYHRQQRSDLKTLGSQTQRRPSTQRSRARVQLSTKQSHHQSTTSISVHYAPIPQRTQSSHTSVPLLGPSFNK